MNRQIKIRRLRARDCKVIAEAFQKQGWNKPLAQYERYLQEQREAKREVLLCEAETEFAGYLTIVWESEYRPFREHKIPEIVDLNVLIKFRKHGLGTRLLTAAESLIAENHKFAGLGVGLTEDYGAAQRLYVKCGYLPDGRGLTQTGKFLRWGDKITVNDDLTLHFVKDLSKF